VYSRDTSRGNSREGGGRPATPSMPVPCIPFHSRAVTLSGRDWCHVPSLPPAPALPFPGRAALQPRPREPPHVPPTPPSTPPSY
jgi:hypothetical protein